MINNPFHHLKGQVLDASTYLYTRAINIDHSKVPSTQSNFTVLIVPTARHLVTLP